MNSANFKIFKKGKNGCIKCGKTVEVIRGKYLMFKYLKYLEWKEI